MKSVLIIVFDGLQPSQITEQHMPNLSGLASKGVTFQYNHNVYPTVTRTNVASLVTGRNPGAHGLIGNTLVMRDFDPSRLIHALYDQLSRVALKTNVLLVPTLADILHKNGMEYIALGVGTSGNAYLHNPNIEIGGGATIHPEFCLPYNLHGYIEKEYGPWPKGGFTDIKKIYHGVDIMIDYVLNQRNPEVALIWFSEPDHTQHLVGVGAKESINVLSKVDEQLGKLLQWIERNERDGDTDVIVLSDHGYSTISKVITVEDIARELTRTMPRLSRDLIMAPNGGSILFYINDRHDNSVDKLAGWLMKQPWCGSIIVSDSAGQLDGTLPASLIGLEGPRTPELIMSFKWDSLANDEGIPGRVYSTGLSVGQGQHGSMSLHETNNVLIANGPSFKKSLKLSSPSGNIDVAPTVLEILGINHDFNMDGRVLFEALESHQCDIQWLNESYFANRDMQGLHYSQEIKMSRVHATCYLDQGQGFHN